MKIEIDLGKFIREAKEIVEDLDRKAGNTKVRIELSTEEEEDEGSEGEPA